jgi:uncharacterized membrane protein YdfJ with MMPL/SSD domain
MTTEQTTPEAPKVTTSKISDEKKAFIGNLLTTSGTIFLLAGVMFFITLVCALKLKQDFLTSLVIGALVVGVVTFSVGITLLAPKK